MRRFLGVATLLVFISMMTVGCSKFERRGVIQNVTRVFMTSPNEYAFMVKNLETGDMELRQIFHQYRFREKKLIPDVQPDQLMWVEYAESRTSDDMSDLSKPSFLRIHIHSESDIGGGGWKERVGKHYEDRTTVVVK